MVNQNKFDLLDILAVDDGSKTVSQLCQHDSGDLVALDAGNVAITDRISDEHNFIALLERFARSRGHADMRHVDSQHDLLDTPRF